MHGNIMQFALVTHNEYLYDDCSFSEDDDFCTLQDFYRMRLSDQTNLSSTMKFNEKSKKKSSTSFSDYIQRTWKRTSEWTVDNVDAFRIEIFPETDKSLLPPRDDIDYKDWDDYYYINKIIIPYLDNLELDEAEDPEYPFISRLSRFREMGRNANVSPLQDILTFGEFEFNDENMTCRFLGRPKLTMAYKGRTINSNPDYGVYTRFQNLFTS
ncbi:hypothetical protein BGW37DRAFT_465322 [Umbelopsis sp. PMI_123]|nr:hypothetical protein BGW37DRAFT_465322 [Umbelopsis sp. PMI_123]